MEELKDIPDEFIGPILPCLSILERTNIFIYEKPRSFWKKYSSLFLTVVSVIAYHTSLTVNMFNMFKGELQLDELAYVVSVYVVCTQAILKATVVALNKKEIRTIIAQLGRIWRTEGFTELQINKKNALLKRLKFCYAVFYWMNIIGSWQYILAPLLETVFRRYILQQECGLLLPFSCSFPFDPTGNWGRYIGVYIFETYSMFRIVYFYLGTEFLMIILCSHLATEFTLLQDDLLNIEPAIKSNQSSWNNLRLMKNVIVKHQKLISERGGASLAPHLSKDSVRQSHWMTVHVDYARLAYDILSHRTWRWNDLLDSYAGLTQELDNIFNKVIFVNLTSASITICFFGFAAKVARGALEMANNFVAVVTLIFPLFNLCYYGELLRESSAGIADSAYHNIWYLGDLSYQKLLWFVIRRSQKPCCLTSMKYNPIALTTFTTVLSTTWSYFSLASSLYEGES